MISTYCTTAPCCPWCLELYHSRVHSSLTGQEAPGIEGRRNWQRGWHRAQPVLRIVRRGTPRATHHTRAHTHTLHHVMVPKSQLIASTTTDHSRPVHPQDGTISSILVLQPRLPPCPCRSHPRLSCLIRVEDPIHTPAALRPTITVVGSTNLARRVLRVLHEPFHRDIDIVQVLGRNAAKTHMHAQHPACMQRPA